SLLRRGPACRPPSRCAIEALAIPRGLRRDLAGLASPDGGQAGAFCGLPPGREAGGRWGGRAARPGPTGARGGNLAQGNGARAALIGWAGEACGAAAVLWPGVDMNLRSRRLAKRLGGAIVGTRAASLPGRPRRACADRGGVAGFSLFGGVLSLDGVGGHPYYPRTLTGGWR